MEKIRIGEGIEINGDELSIKSTALRCGNQPAPPTPAPVHEPVPSYAPVLTASSSSTDDPLVLRTKIDTKAKYNPLMVEADRFKELKKKVESLTDSVNILTEEDARKTEAIASMGDGHDRMWKDLDTLEGRVDVLWRDVTELTAIHETEKAVNDAFDKNTKAKLEELECLREKVAVAHKVALVGVACSIISLAVLAVSVIILGGHA